MKYYASEKHDAKTQAKRLATLRWRRNIVAAMTTGALVMSAFSPAALSGIALANTSGTAAGNAALTASSVNDADAQSSTGSIYASESVASSVGSASSVPGEMTSESTTNSSDEDDEEADDDSASTGDDEAEDEGDVDGSDDSDDADDADYDDTEDADAEDDESDDFEDSDDADDADYDDTEDTDAEDADDEDGDFDEADDADDADYDDTEDADDEDADDEDAYDDDLDDADDAEDADSSDADDDDTSNSDSSENSDADISGDIERDVVATGVAAKTSSASKSSATNSSSTSKSTTTTTKKKSSSATGTKVATPNEKFGAPTTSVVIDGSVNGEIMAKVALAEPDGIPEGGDSNKYNYGSGEAWCAYFVMYCARAAGLSTEVIPDYPNCQSMVDYYKGLNRWQSFTKDYQAHVGDLVFFSETVGGVASHVGIVTASTETTITTREGNAGYSSPGMVATHVLSTTNDDGYVANDYYILGYAAPDYPDKNDHEHTNNIVSVTDVSDTYHLVTYAPCACGYEKPADLVAHNFKGTDASVKLSDSDEWECVDCGAKQTHYSTGIRLTSAPVKVYDTENSTEKKLPAGTYLGVTYVWLGDDGNYWGSTVEGYSVKMSEAGVKQTSQIVAIDMDERDLACDAELVASCDCVMLGDDSTTAKRSSDGDSVDATCSSLVKLEAGNVYVVTVDAIYSTAADGTESKYLGSPLFKLMDVDDDGSYDVNDLKVYGSMGQKVKISDTRQGVIIAPDSDMTLVAACQGGKKATCNDVTYEGVNVYRVG